MKVTVFGAGYVGLVTGACLAEMGNHVLCVDVDPRKIDMLKRGTPSVATQGGVGSDWRQKQPTVKQYDPPK